MNHPINVVNERFYRLQLHGYQAEATCYDIKKDIKVLIGALKSFGLDYDISIRSKSQISKLCWVEILFNCPDHC